MILRSDYITKGPNNDPLFAMRILIHQGPTGITNTYMVSLSVDSLVPGNNKCRVPSSDSPLPGDIVKCVGTCVELFQARALFSELCVRVAPTQGSRRLTKYGARERRSGWQTDGLDGPAKRHGFQYRNANIVEGCLKLCLSVALCVRKGPFGPSCWFWPSG